MNAGLVSPITLTGYATQAVGAVILAVLLLGFFRSYRQRYLRDWAFSWWALAVFNAATLVAIWVSPQYGVLHPTRLLSSGVSQVSAYWHLAWLLFGAIGIAYSKEISPRLRTGTLVALLALGVTATILFTWDPSAATARLLLRYGLRSILAAAAFFVAAVLIWRVRTSTPKRGPRLVSVALALYGANWLYNAAVPVLGILGASLGTEFPSYLRIAEVFLVFLIGLGMVVWFLEEERERTQESENRFRTIAEAAFEGVSISANGVILDANSRLGEILGTDRSSLLGKLIIEFVAPESRDMFMDRTEESAEEPHEYLGLRSDGSVFPAEVREREITHRGRSARVTVLRDVTLRKRVEGERARRARRESEERFRAFVETANDAILSVNVEGEILLWNPAAEAIFGYRAGEILGKPLTTLIPERLRQAHLTAFESHAPGGEVKTLGQADEVIGLRKDGGEFPAEISMSTGEYDGKTVFNAILRDVSERKVAQEALEHLSRQHELLLNSAGEGIVGVDQDGVVSFANPASLSLIGWGSHEALGRAFHELVHHSHEDGTPLPESECVALDALRTGGGTRGETVYWRRDGSPLPVAYSCTPIVEGEDVMGAVIVFEDITERREAVKALRHSESKYRSLVEHATYGIYRSTPEGEFVAVNPALVDMLGYDSEDELLSTNLGEEIYVDPEERERLIRQYEEAGRIDAVDLRWRRRDGGPITVRVSGRPLRNEQGSTEAFEMIAEDVTAHRKLEEQLRQSQKMEAVGQLTGGIAHDFNNELSVILLNSELLAATLDAGDPVEREDLDAIHGAAQRAARVTRQLLGFSRQADLRMEATDLREVISGLSGMIRTVVPEMIDVRISADRQVSTVQVDSGVVEQILLNLVTNARDAMPRGGTLQVEVSEEEVDANYADLYPNVSHDRYVFITVSDTGIGMNREVQARLFEPFFTTKPQGEGTGLGMAMVYGLTEQQEGHVHVYSEPDHGTTIRIGFPASVDAASDVVSPKVVEVVGGEETILLVEDEPAVRGTAKRVLERAGYSVVAAADGEEGLSLYRASPGGFDLVLSDLIMPKMGGLQLYEALQDEWGDVPFVLASGYVGRELEEGASLDPSIPFVQKPWRLTELLKRVREAIDDSGGAADE